MNLADAIRQAALRQAEEQSKQEEPMAQAPNPERPADPADAPYQEFQPVHDQPASETGANEAQSPPDWQGGTGKLTLVADQDEASRLFAADSATGEPVAVPEHPLGSAGGNAVRFEIFLSPEQLSCLFRALVATQHSMMTLREAANYLRIPAGTLEQYATEGRIPALQIEGRWRFPKSGVDEWVMLQSFRDGEVSDAA